MAIPEDPQAVVPAVLIGLMMAGVLLDCFRFGREGWGGSITFLSGIVFYVFILYGMVVRDRTYSEGQVAALTGTLILFLSGILFYLCGRRTKKAGR